MDSNNRRSERHRKESSIIAIVAGIAAVVFYFVSELVGFDKMKPGATPKRLPEVVAHLPKILVLGVVVFIATWWYQMSQKEKKYKICCNCTETYEIVTESLTTCQKCGGMLEELVGFYDRHPEKRT